MQQQKQQAWNCGPETPTPSQVSPIGMGQSLKWSFQKKWSRPANPVYDPPPCLTIGIIPISWGRAARLFLTGRESAQLEQPWEPPWLQQLRVRISSGMGSSPPQVHYGYSWVFLASWGFWLALSSGCPLSSSMLPQMSPWAYLETMCTPMSLTHPPYWDSGVSWEWTQWPLALFFIFAFFFFSNCVVILFPRSKVTR